MKGRLLLLVFIIVVACNSFAAVTPHADGEGGCSTACCRNAREGNSTSAVSRLRCLMNCEQPAGHQAASPANAFSSERQKERAPASVMFATGPALGRAFSLAHSGARRETFAPARAPVSLYLQTGSLLI
ncbi:MAG TPA: hypothetical protein VE262_20075 [Blastocatellia bacterium]|nr:hypothetical protein [Blastocatellia bacterium]